VPGSTQILTSVRRLLPTGASLPDDVWMRRHRGIVTLLWLHAVGIPIFGAVRGYPPVHVILEASVIGIAALVAGILRLNRNLRMVAATFGLLASSGVLVHLSGGIIEMHFHFFVMVAVITLYQSWLPFLLAIGFVVLHHGTIGVLDPASVYNHPSAIANPWLWAGVHGLFISGESIACLTAWRMSEVAHARAEEVDRKLVALVRSTDDAIIALNSELAITSWNPAAEKLFGYSQKEAMGESFAVLFPTGEDGRSPEEVIRDLTNEGLEPYETHCVRKDGSIVDVALTLSPIMESEGMVVGTSVIARNITAQKMAEQERESSLSLLSATLESTNDGILVVDRENNIVRINQMFLEMWGIPAEIVEQGDEAALGFVLDQLKNPEKFLSKVRELYADLEAKSYDLLEFKDGKIFERYSQPQKIGGETVGRVWSFRDITERQRAADSLQQAFEREKEASQSLRDLDEMKNAFLEAVSHELRTPLTTVLGNALTLERRGASLSSSDNMEMLKSLSKNARKLERLLSDLLDLDRLARGVLEPHLVDSNISDLVRNTLEDVDMTRHPVEIETDEVIAMVDAPKVQRIIENLVANAVKYTPPGTRIWVRVKAEPDALSIIVEDEGPGVPQDLKKEVFEPFLRGKDGPSHAPGTGIGLALVSRFAELHNGEAWVEDRPGGGARFQVRLPSQIVLSAESKSASTAATG
jgi:PAS domain S-box-containing protein